MNNRLLAAAFAAGTLLWVAPARGAFTTVVNVPPDPFSADSVFGADTQINLYSGATAHTGEVIQLGDFNAPAENVQMNVLGGFVWAVDAWTGSQLNVSSGSVNAANLLGGRGFMSGGYVLNWTLFAEGRLEMSGGVAAEIYTGGNDYGPISDVAYFVMDGGQVGLLDATGNVVIHGGVVGEMVFRGAGFVELTGGAIGDGFEVGSVVVGALPEDPMREVVVGGGGRVLVRGGSIGQGMILRDGRTLDYSGGVIGDALQVLDGSEVNIRGSHFLIDGLEPIWPASRELTLTQRDVALTGVLADGQAFRFDLNSQPGHGDYFSPEALVTIMLVPEPWTGVAPLLLMLAFARHRRCKTAVG
jgi:hypothetical protein